MQLALLDEREARDLTDRIKGTAEQLWSLLLEAHERQAWRPLGYTSWSVYIATEFDMTKRHANRLVAQGQVIRELEEVVGPSGPTLHVTEAETRDLKPVIDDVVEEVRVRTAAEPERPPAEVVRDVVEETRERLRESDDDPGLEALALKAIGATDSTTITHLRLLENAYRCAKAVRANILRLDPDLLGEAIAHSGTADRQDWQSLADDFATWHGRLMESLDQHAVHPFQLLTGGQQ